ncbi:MAG TPA: alpha-ketoacid dehydrogenase subunit beta [Acidimicrobiales bacterium]
MTATETTEVEMMQLPMVAAINQTLAAALEADEKVFLLGEDIADPSGGVYKATMGLSTRFGTHRVRDTPISEQAIMGAAIGAAIAGYRPVAEIMIMDFLAVCMDQLANHAAKLRYMSGGQTSVPITVRCSAGGGMQFGAQHSEMLEAWLCHIPGLKVVVPSGAGDAKGLLTSCIFDDDPCVFVEQTVGYFMPSEVPAGDYRIPLGQAAVRREGDDLTIISYGRQVGDAVAVAEQLAGDGVSVEVVDLRTLVPLDTETVLTSVAKTGRAVVVHEAVTRCGFGAELSAVITENVFDQLKAPVRRVGAKNTPVPYARELEAVFAPARDDIVAAVHQTIEGSSR